MQIIEGSFLPYSFFQILCTSVGIKNYIEIWKPGAGWCASKFCPQKETSCRDNLISRKILSSLFSGKMFEVSSCRKVQILFEPLNPVQTPTPASGFHPPSKYCIQISFYFYPKSNSLPEDSGKFKKVKLC